MILSLGRVESSFLKIFDDVLDNVLSCTLLWSIETFEKSLGPNDAMNDFFWLLPDGTNRESLVFLPLDTLVARRASLDNTDTSHVIAVGTCIDKG